MAVSSCSSAPAPRSTHLLRYRRSCSGIINDVNQWGLEQGKPRYIIDLVNQVVTLSLRTVDIVDSLPKLRFDEHGTHVITGDKS